MTHPIRPASLIRRGRPKLLLQRRTAATIGRFLEAKVFGCLGGPVLFQIARLACNFDLIGLVKRRPGITRVEIQQELKLPEGAAHVLLLGCVSMKLLKCRGERYFCLRLGLGSLLDRSKSFSIAPHLELIHHLVEPAVRHLEEALRSGTPAGLKAFPGEDPSFYGRIAQDDKLQRVFYDSMNSRAQTANPHFMDRIDFSSFQNILDVAGGDGEMLQTIAERYPRLQGTVLEIPSVAELATQRFTQHNLSERLKSVSADILQEDFPAGHDGILFCHVLGNHSPATNLRLMQRAFAALPSGGIVMIYSAFMDDDASGPLSAAVLSAFFYCVMAGPGRQYSRKECEGWLTEAGFQEITRVALIMNHGVLLARKP